MTHRIKVQHPWTLVIGAAWKGKGKKGKGKGLKGKGKGFKGKGKGFPKGQGKGFPKGKGRGFPKGKGKGKGLKGKNNKRKNDGCFICGSRDHWANNCPRAYTQGALWQIEEGSEWNEDEDGTDWNEQQTGENGENADWSDYQGALYDDSAWTEDDWYADWWYDDGYDWSSDWSWYEDSSWQASHWATEAPQLALPAPQQPIVTQSPAAAQVAHWHQAQQQQTAAAVIAGPPGLVASDQIANDSLIASSSSSSSNSRGSGSALILGLQYMCLSLRRFVSECMRS